MAVRESEDARVDGAWDAGLDTDLELEPIAAELEDYASAPADYQVTYYPADCTLETWHEMWRDGEIIIPKFQRGFVWKPAQSSRLIESFLMGLPVPPVYLYLEYRALERLVIDGQQRLKSVFYFLEGRFGEDTPFPGKEFRLTGLGAGSRLQGKSFTDLGPLGQKRIKHTILRAMNVQSVIPDDYASVYPIFERLNNGGVALSAQELRNGIHNGRFVELLRELNRNPQWRQILGKAGPDRRERDVELLTRFFALRDAGEYRKPMKDFLSRFMQENRDAPEGVLAKRGQVFRDTCGQVVAALGEQPFHGKSGLNVAVLDAVLVAFSENLDRVPADIKARYQELRGDAKFAADTRQGTTEAAVVQRRLAQAKTVLFG